MDVVGIQNIVCDPPSGSIFNIGTTVVTCTATDVSGNENSITFNVAINLLVSEVPPIQNPSSKNIISVNPIQSKVPSSGKTSEILFSGNIENYGRGTPVIIEIFNSLNFKSTFTVFGTDSGSYQFLYPLTDQNPPGKYTADILYQNQKINSVSFALIEVESETLVLPSWIKSNARWWEKDLITDDDFIKGIEYLVSNRIIIV